MFIGVGGIGSKIVRRVADKCGNTDLTNIRFVVMDTDVNDLRKISDGCKAAITRIQTSSAQSVGAYLDYDKEANKKWFPKNSILYGKTVSEGAGQVRAISRLALNATIRQGNIKDLYKVIDELFAKDGRDLQQALRICIVSTSAGGTGSGLVTALSMLLREYMIKTYPESSCIFRGLLLLPGVLDTVITADRERNSIRRNGYATIKEINAFMMKASGFFDVERRLRRYSDLSVSVPDADGNIIRLAHLPFDFCFLLDRLDLNQGSMRNMDQYLDYAAQSLFEQNLGPMQAKAFSKEDNIIKELASKQNLGRNRFGAIGAAVMQYPYENIADYVAMSWAVEQLGGEEEARGWLKYDKEYIRQLNEYKKNGSSRETPPDRGKVYIDTLKNDTLDKLSINLKRRYLGGEEPRDVDDHLSDAIGGDMAGDVGAESGDTFFGALNKELQNRLESIGDYKTPYDALRPLLQKGHFTNENNRGKYKSSFNAITAYASQVQRLAESVGKNAGNSIFWNDSARLGPGSERYSIDSILQAENGGVHPNAARVYLYTLRDQLRERIKEAKEKIKDSSRIIAQFSPQAKDRRFRLYLAKKKDANAMYTLNDVLTEEAQYTSKKFGVKRKLKPLYDQLSKWAREYIGAADNLALYSLRLEAYQIALEYTLEICKAYENFFDGFETKCKGLRVKQEDLEKEMEFSNGDSVMRICATKDMLGEIVEICSRKSDDMLPEDLNANIYNTLKSNVILKREMASDQNLIDRRVDVFDYELVEYFKKAVREDCKDILDKTILKAIQWECELKSLIAAKKVWEKLGDPTAEKPSAVSLDKQELSKYIRDRLEEGKRLASPGISTITLEDEPRMVSECAFNEVLKLSRSLKVSDYLASDAGASKNVSKYELHFFEAIYNITPDKLARFAAPKAAETVANDGGIYYSSYQSYMRDIGPDSTKSMVISPHIDKRWDTIAVMPELDMGHMEVEMKRIHTALIYGLIYGLIKRRRLSVYNLEKKVFQLEDSEGDIRELIVSNETACDEFYEVLDSLYRDRRAVEDLLSNADAIREKDNERRTKYDLTQFAQSVNSLKLEVDDSEPKARDSVFAIPLLYYKSLPNQNRDDNELMLMIDSIVDVFRREMETFDRPDDRESHLSLVMKEQYELLVQNYKDDLDRFVMDTAITSNYEDNDVIQWIVRKLKEIMEQVHAKSDHEKDPEAKIGDGASDADGSKDSKDDEDEDTAP
jgi:hypothetical protein